MKVIRFCGCYEARIAVRAWETPKQAIERGRALLEKAAKESLPLGRHVEMTADPGYVLLDHKGQPLGPIQYPDE